MEPVVAPILPERWSSILESVQQALTQADAEAAKSLAALEVLAPEPNEAVWQNRMGELEEKALRLEACASGADLVAGEVEFALQASETALREWLDRAEAIRASLANRPAGSV